MANNNQIFKMSNAGGFKSLTRYYDMLAGNTTWNPWEPAGAFDALATVTVPSGGVASVTFAGIPTGYKHLQIRAIARANGGSSNYSGGMQMNFNGDTASNYFGHQLYGTGSAAGSGVPTGSNPVSSIWLTTGSAQFAGHIIDILDYASTSKNKTIRHLGGTDNNGGGVVVLESGAWNNSTSAISSIVFGISGSSFNQYSQFSLFGVK